MQCVCVTLEEETRVVIDLAWQRVMLCCLATCWRKDTCILHRQWLFCFYKQQQQQ
jgi:hypothetical protein